LPQLRDGSALGASRNSNDQGFGGISAPTRRPGTNRLPGGACIPAFLEPWKYKILLAGKYLNVIRECGTEILKWDNEREQVGEDASSGEPSDKVVTTPTTTSSCGPLEKEIGLIRMNDVK
jgi:gamma-tubulin complex component 2